MTKSKSMAHQVFPTSVTLQDFLLKEITPGTLTLVPHQRLARQVWHRQRQRALAQDLAAWEPLPLVTLGHWWADLSRSLWLPEPLASPLQRLVFWQRALAAGPALEGLTPDLAWAQALDEAYSLLCRHRLLSCEPDPQDSPLHAWRRRLTAIFQGICREEGCLTEADLTTYLLRALDAGQLPLPQKLLVAGLETPAPVEEAWLQAVARRLPVVHLRLQGHPQAVKEAVVLPDKRQEVDWAAARLLELAQEGLPLHRLALTSPDLAGYLPELRRVMAELMGPPHPDQGGAYNFSQGPTLAETPLWQAALLPLKFVSSGELRADLVSLLLSPYYRLFQERQSRLPLWDRVFRERRVERGWEALRRVAAQGEQAEPGGKEVLEVLNRVRQILRPAPARGGEWAARLTRVWQILGFPCGLEETEMGQWSRVTDLLRDLAGPLAAVSLTATQFREWLTLGARQVLLPGEGVQDAGLQVLGLLEMRGLDFERVLCLGLNSGVFPPPPRPLPLLSPPERQKVLGGTYQSQHRLAREAFDALLAAAPALTLTRPRLVDQEECVATSMYGGPWREEEISPLSRPHPAWLRSPGVRAAFAPAPGPSSEAAAPIDITLPGEVSLTQAQIALGCPCRFLLEILLAIRDLPEIEAGLSPAERGDRLHKVLARFASDFKKILEEHQYWGDEQAEEARKLLQATARLLLEDRLEDLHWQAEWERWLGEEGLLWEWLRLERERFHQGWRWLALEERFQDLAGAGWPFKLKGRIDRIDWHRDEGLILWDYKTGEVPKAPKVFDDLEEFQLPGYLAAIKQGRVDAATGDAPLRAGYIGLKSALQKHLQHEDFPKRAGEWGRVIAAWEERLAALGRRLAAGDYSPQPTPAPQGRKGGACQYCPHLLICGYQIPESPEDEEEGE
jgi:exodeoxyribonuclease-5